MDKKDDTKEILETVIFIRDKVVSIENEVAEVKRDVREVHNRLDDELDKRKALEVRISQLES